MFGSACGTGAPWAGAAPYAAPFDWSHGNELTLEFQYCWGAAAGTFGRAPAAAAGAGAGAGVGCDRLANSNLCVAADGGFTGLKPADTGAAA